ncbi:MAG TPA: hypothetical protein PKV78_13600 [Methanoculleus thermophilus]|nr:hypothetical protein [Bacillota bacterium]HQD27562.1 hypothetical protein [Methanoculleus thermophilus]
MVEPIPEGGLDLGIPTRGSKEGYLGLYFISRQQLGNIIGNLQGVTDQRLEIFTRFMISSITDRETREELLEKLNEELEKARDLRDVEERGRAAMVAYMDVIGDVTEWYDEFLGITHRLVIGTV